VDGGLIENGMMLRNVGLHPQLSLSIKLMPSWYSQNLLGISINIIDGKK
jgi:hypothetical protein